MTRKTKPAARQPKATPRLYARANARLDKVQPKSEPAKKAPQSVYTPAAPPISLAINAARAIRILRQIPAPTAPLAQVARHAYETAWHVALAERDAQDHAATLARIQTHNLDVAGIASAVDLTARDRTGTGILSFDWQDMLRRIEQAAAKHANKGKRGHKSANRHLAYHCPVCSERREKPDGTIVWSNTIRASASDRIIMCAGRHGAQHAPALCEFDMSSQPDYRLADSAAGTAIDPEGTAYVPEANPEGAHGGTRGDHSRSLAQIASRKAKYAADMAAAGIPEPTPLTDPKDEFGF